MKKEAVQKVENSTYRASSFFKNWLQWMDCYFNPWEMCGGRWAMCELGKNSLKIPEIR
jgi:hypothetical protein